MTFRELRGHSNSVFPFVGDIPNDVIYDVLGCGEWKEKDD
jgi:hypothetical protein